MIKKRITALLVAFSILITLIPANMGVALADSSAPYIEDGIIALFDFSDTGSIPSKYLESGNKYRTEASTEVAYEGKSGSLKWTMDESGTDIDIPLDKYDYTSLIGHPDATIKVRFYSEATGSKFNLLCLPDNANFSGKYNIKYPVITGGWQVVDFKLSDVLTKVQYSSLGLLSVRFNDTGWDNYKNGGYTSGDVIYVDSIWIELPSYGSTMAAPTPSVENGAAYVDADLGGSNTYTLTFAEDIWQYTYSAGGTDYSAAEGVKVYEFDGSGYTETAQTYTTAVSGSTISLVFDEPLADQCAYKVVADKAAILAASGKKLSNDAEYYFSVGMSSVNFNVISTSVSSGAAVDASEPGFTYTIGFSNTPDNYDIGKMFTVTKDGEKYTDFTVACEEKTVTLTFPSGLPGGCDYAITISDDFADTNGFYISGTKELTFSTPVVVGSDGVVFSAADSNDMTKIFNFIENTTKLPANYSVEADSEHALTGDTTFRINHPVVTSGQFNSLVSDKLVADINEYTYINYLIYSPKATNEQLVLQLRETSSYSGRAWYVATITTDWQGWKTVSLKISDFTNLNMSGKVDKFIVNIGGWAAYKAEAGFFCVDRIWLGNELPAEITYTDSEYGYEQAFVPNDLGGDNTYSFTYSGDIAAVDYTEAVSVYKYDGEEYVEADGYSVNAAGNKLNVAFDSALSDGDTVKIAVDGAVFSSEYAACFDKAEAIFTVNAPTPYFKITDSSVEDGAVLQSLTQLVLTFSNNIDEALYVPDYISLYRDGEKLYNAFDASIDGKVLTLDMTKEMTAGTYTIKISTDYTDMYGYKYIGNTQYSFIIDEKAETDDVVTIFSANSDEHMNATSKWLESSTEITNLYPRTSKVAYTVGVSKNGWFRYENVFDATDMKYLNFWIYSPKATGNIAHIAIYTSIKDNKYNTGNQVYTMGVDWQGWKLVTIPMSSLSAATTFDAFLINFGGWSGGVRESSYILVDEVWLSGKEPVAVELKETSFPDKYTGAAVSGEILRLTFAAELNSVQNQSQIVITDENGVDLGGDKYSVDFGTDSMTITFGELAPSTTYNISVNGIVGKQPVIQTKPIEMSFTTSDGGVYLTDIACGDTVDFRVDNLSSASADIKLAVYAIGEDNALLAKSVKSVTLAAQTAETVSVEFTAPAGTTDIKAFVLDSKGRLVSDKYASLKSGAAEYTLSSPLSGSSVKAALDASITVNVLEANIELAALSNLVTIEISDSKGNVVSANAAAAGADGKLQYYYVFPASAPTDMYTVSINADGLTASQELSYLSKADREGMLTLANGTSTSDFADFIADNAAALGIGDASDELIDDMAELVIGSGNFGSYTEVVDFINSIFDFLYAVNSAPWATITELINDNAALLGEDNSDIEYFTGLSEKKQNIVSTVLKEKLPADSITDLLSKLGDAIDEYKEENESSSSGGGSSGGGGSGGKSSGGSFPVASESKPYTPVEAQTVFTDLGDAGWATESIMTLYKEGIVSYSADNRFRPNDNITREEFVKLVVCAFAANQPASDHSFTDAVPGQWYNEYISKAYAAGIATGYPDGSFGIGENITREDMVTIIGRTLVLMGAKLPEGQSASFSDSGEISSYARSYVDAMVQLGVVNGMGNGTFAPKAYSTRAQAAKVIASLMELF